MNSDTPEKDNADSCQGQIFDKRYELQAKLGEGATGTAYKARDILLDRLVVVKVLHRFLLASPEALDRFRHEAITTTELGHHGIVQVYSHGVADDGRPYMVMDCLEGQSLAEILRTETKLAIERFFNLFLQVIEALDFAHRKGVIHRDVKPSNIIVIQDAGGERAILVDFGLAKLLTPEGDQNSTRTGAMLGSSAYMSPEQCRGVAVDARSDIYSLGCVMFESLIGKPPFEGESQLDVMYKHLNESAGKLGQLNKMPDALAKILRKSLEKNVDKRYQDLPALRRDFESCAEMQDTIKRRLARIDKSGKITRPLGAIIAVLLLITCASIYGLVTIKKSKNNVEQTSTTPKITAENVPLAPSEDSVYRLVSKYKLSGRFKESMTVLHRWEKQYMSRTDDSILPAKIYVLKSIIQQLIQEADLDSVPKYMSDLRKLDNTPTTSIFIAANTARMYRILLQPDKGVQSVETELQQLSKDPTFPTLDGLSDAFIVEGDCWFDTGNYTKATEAYKRAIEVTERRNGLGAQEANAARVKAIVALTRNGKTAEADKLLNVCANSIDPDNEGSTQDRKVGHQIVSKLLNVPESVAKSTYQSRSAIAGSKADLYMTVAREFLGRADCPSYVRNMEKAIALETSVGLTSRAEKHQYETCYNCISYSDSADAIKAINKLLSKAKNDQERIRLLVLLSNVEVRELKQAEDAHSHLTEAYNLMEKSIKQNPDMLWKEPSTICMELLQAMSDSAYTSSDKMLEMIDSFINRCHGHDCTTLRSVTAFKADLLRGMGNLDDSLAICQQNLEFFKKNGTPDQLNCRYDWLMRKAEIMAKKENLNETLNEYQEASTFVDSLDPPVKLIRQCDILTRKGDVYSALGKPDEALKCYTEVERLIGPDNLATPLDSNSMDQLVRFGGFCVRHGYFDKARKLYSRVERFQSLLYGNDSPKLVHIKLLKGELLLQENKKAEAKQAFQHVHDQCLKAHLEDSPINTRAVEALSKL